MALVLCYGCGSRVIAEEASEALDRAGLAAIQGVAGDESEFDARAFAEGLLTGRFPRDAASVRRIVGSLIDNTKRELSSLAGNIAAPLALCALLRLMFGARAGMARAPGLLCTVCCAAALAETCGAALDAARALTECLVRAVNGMTPVLLTLASFGGTGAGGSAVSPLAALCADCIEHLVGGWGLKLCTASVLVAVAGGLSERFALRRLFALLQSAERWLLGASMFAFGAAVSVRGAMAKTGESVAMRAAQGVIEGAIPIIGGELSDAAGLMAVSAGAIRSAVGITGLAAMLWLCLEPMLKLAASMLALKVLAAVTEPVADAQISGMLGRCGAALEMALACCAACAVLAGLLIGGCLALAGGAFG